MYRIALFHLSRKGRKEGDDQSDTPVSWRRGKTNKGSMKEGQTEERNKNIY